MSTLARIGTFLGGLAVVFSAAYGVGNAVGPVDPIGTDDGDRGIPVHEEGHE